MTDASVLDASAALSLLVPTQATARSDAFGAAISSPLIAPSVFSAEIRHAVLRLERRAVIPVGGVDTAMAVLEAKVALAPIVGEADLMRTQALARRFSLGFFDALYLDLTIMQSATLVTRDGPLIEAARAAGLAVIDLR